MRLRKRILLVIGATAVVMLGVLSFTSNSIFMRGFARVEHDDTDRNAKRAQDALGGLTQALATKCFDWAAWDDAWQFLSDGNDDFVKDNVADVTLADMKLSAIVMVNTAGEVKFARGCDLETSQTIDLSPTLLAMLKPGSPLHDFKESNDLKSGIVMLPDGPMLVAARPVVHTDHSGPIAGALLFGQKLGPAQLAALTDQLHMPISLLSYADAMARPEWRDSATELAGRSEIEKSNTTVRVASDDTISGFALVRDVQGHPGFVLRIDLPRTIWAQGQQSVAYATRAIAGMGVAFALMTLGLLDSGVLRRLAILRDELAGIGRQGGLAGRVTVAGTDEISDVSSNVNRMLEELQNLELTTRARDEECRKLALVASRTDNAVVITDSKGRIEWVNDGFVRLTGHLPEEVAGKRPGEFLQGRESDPSTIALMRESLRSGDGFSVELLNYTRSRRAYWAAVDAQPVYDADQNLTNYIAVIKDVSERRAAEQSAREREAQLRTLVANIPGVVYHYQCGATWQVAFLSDAIEELSGYNAKDFLAGGTRTLHDVIHPDDASRVSLAIEGAALRGEPYQLEYRIRRSDGATRWVIDRGRPGHAADGRLLCLDGVLFDITDQKAAESLRTARVGTAA